MKLGVLFMGSKLIEKDTTWPLGEGSASAYEDFFFSIVIVCLGGRRTTQL